MAHPKKITISKILKVNQLPEGIYEALWGGYNVHFNLSNGFRVDLEMSEGLRGMNIPCTVTVKNGVVNVELNE